MVAKRAKSAYFVFADDQRVVTKSELQAAASDGKVVSVAEIAKSLGNKWRELGEAGQQAYKDKAASLAAEAAEDVQPAESSQGDGQIPDDQKAEQEGADVPGLPLLSVKRIMCLDEDVTRVSGESVRAVAKLTELFLELFAAKAFAKARQHKRATIKFCDTSQAVTSDRRLVEMGLKDMFACDAVFEDARDDHKENTIRSSKQPQAANTPAARPITDFFKL